VEPYCEDDHVIIFNGDCLEPLVHDIQADVLVTDPPYGMAYKSGWLNREIVNDRDTTVRDAVLEIWNDRPALVFERWDCPHPSASRMCLTWDKGDWPGMGDLALPWGPSTEEIYVIGSGFVGKRQGSVVRHDRKTGMTLHPNEKPVSLLGKLIAKCPPGVILDPFMGSGTTLRAAKDLGRKAIGIEIDERYCEIAAKRLAQEVLF
jgi:site-specific DNA-methyltransferase (adenine-specific)